MELPIILAKIVKLGVVNCADNTLNTYIYYNSEQTNLNHSYCYSCLVKTLFTSSETDKFQLFTLAVTHNDYCLHQIRACPWSEGSSCHLIIFINTDQLIVCVACLCLCLCFAWFASDWHHTIVTCVSLCLNPTWTPNKQVRYETATKLLPVRIPQHTAAHSTVTTNWQQLVDNSVFLAKCHMEFSFVLAIAYIYHGYNN